MPRYTRFMLVFVLLAAGCKHDQRPAPYKPNPNDPYDVQVTDTVAHGEMDRNCFSVKPPSASRP